MPAALWLQNATTPAVVDRAVLTGAFRGEGALSGLVLTPDGGMDVEVGAGVAVVIGDTDFPAQGSYLCPLPTATNVTISAAPGAGTRYDLICAQVRDSAEDGGGNDDWQLIVVVGTPSVGTPTAPALPDSCAEIGRVVVTAGDSVVTSAMLFRGQPKVVGQGGVSVSDNSSRFPASPSNGDVTFNLADGLFYARIGGSWVIFPSIPADASVTTAKLADGSVTREKVASEAWDTVAVDWENPSPGIGTCDPGVGGICSMAYDKQGRSLHFRIWIHLGSTPSGGSSGVWWFIIPFVAASTLSGAQQVFACVITNAAGNVNCQARISQGGSTISIYAAVAGAVDNAATQLGPASHGAFAEDDTIMIQGTMEVAT